jgi:hypothetical protein
MDKWSEIILGLVLIVIAVLVSAYSSSWYAFGLSFNFGPAAWNFLKGGLIWLVILVGLLFLMLGISDLKD